MPGQLHKLSPGRSIAQSSSAVAIFQLVNHNHSHSLDSELESLFEQPYYHTAPIICFLIARRHSAYSFPIPVTNSEVYYLRITGESIIPPHN